jgi:hypothetical protein
MRRSDEREGLGATCGWVARPVLWGRVRERPEHGVSQERFGDLALLTTVTLTSPPIRAAVGSTNSRGALRLLQAVPPTS